jgi:hypothetical protein
MNTLKTLLLSLSLSSCVLVAPPPVPRPYCQPLHPDVLMCRDGHYGHLWRCVYEFGRWRCRRATW